MATQQLLLGSGGKKDYLYIDDVFSTDVWTGTGSAVSIDTGVDMTDGGMVWIKPRASGWHNIIDTVGGTTKVLYPNATNDYDTVSGGMIDSFDNNGYNLLSTGSGGNYFVGSGDEYVGWSWKKQEKFFDIVTWTGNATNRTISHSLGCIPGMIIVKCTSADQDWNVYHSRSHETNPRQKYLDLNTTDALVDHDNRWNDVEPTATEFTVGTAPEVNGSGNSYIAYLFAGGKSTSATAKSTGFHNSSSRLRVGTNTAQSDFDFGTGDVTFELWFKANETQVDKPILLNVGESGHASDTCHLYWDHEDYENKVSFWIGNFSATACAMSSTVKGFNNDGQWHHVAVTRASNKFRLFVDGVQEDSRTYTGNTNDGNSYIGVGNSTETNMNNGWFNGYITNVRIVKGTAVYTDSFLVPTAPLTNITNTVLLFSNQASATGTTVSPITPLENSTYQGVNDSPFDDPLGFTFGPNEDQNVIKCGHYKKASNSGPHVQREVICGWEPQWLMIKPLEGGTYRPWIMFDNVRGVASGYEDAVLYANAIDAEDTANARVSFRSNGFTVDTNSSRTGDSTDGLVYIAIRRPDGYVGKPAEAGTEVFAMDTPTVQAAIPNFDSTFDVDFGLARIPGQNQNWYVGTKKTQGYYKLTNSNAVEGALATMTLFDHNKGWGAGSWNADYQSWMWKRHKGFDIVHYTGNGMNDRPILHTLNAVPEMIWVKNRQETQGWRVYHKGLNGGTNPEQYGLILNLSSAESDDATYWRDLAPNNKYFFLGNSDSVNKDAIWFEAFLFSSVDGISKLGYYTGPDNGSDGANTMTINVGFQPRFLLIKCTSHNPNWIVLDTLRGFGSGNDKPLFLDNTTAQETNQDWGTVSSTGFSINGGFTAANDPNKKYIYYAHA